MYKSNPLFQKTSKVSQFPPEMESKHKEYSPEEDKLNWEWYNPNENSVPVSFCMDTSLHGLKFVGQQKRHIFERLFWMATFTGSVVTAIVLILGMWSDYRNNPTITIFSPTELNLDEIPFPALTICSVNSLQKTTIKDQRETVWWHSHVIHEVEKHLLGQQLSEESLQAVARILDMNNICDSTLTFTDRFVKNGSILDLFDRVKELIENHSEQVEKYIDPIGTLQNVSQPCSKMILHCVWLEVKVNCSEIFQEIATDFGNCCAFNTMPITLLLTGLNNNRDKPDVVKEWKDANLDYEKLIFTKETENRTYPYRQRYPGRSAGLSFLLDPDLDEYFCTNTDSEGFIMGINVPIDFPRMKDNGIAIQTNSEIFLGLKPEVTMSHHSIKDFPVERRKCYYGSEYKLPHYTKYTVSNCMNECIARRTMEYCGCIRYYMPHDESDDLCKPSQYNCTDHVQMGVIYYGLSTACSDCLPTCTHISYQKEISFLPLRRKKIQDLYEVVHENPELGTQNYNQRKVSIVHVYFSKESVHPRIRKEMTTVTELMSNAGGLLGLCMGFSVLSLLEILYYGSLRLCCTFYREKTIQNRSQMTTGENENQQQRPSSDRSIHPKQAWFGQMFNEGSDIHNIDKRTNLINKPTGFQADSQYDDDEYMRIRNEVFRGNHHSQNKHVHFPGSFEEQLQRAFMTAAYQEKNNFSNYSNY